MNKWTKILFGLVLLLGVILIAYYSQNWIVAGKSLNFWNPAWVFLKGGLFWIIFLLGLLFLLLGISELRE